MPVPYFMVTFTVPYELRHLVYSHQKTTYSLMFECAEEVLKSFGLKTKNLGADIGMTMILHTHSRKLEYHQHIHARVPGGGIDKRHGLWKMVKKEYLFNGFALAEAFRKRLIEKNEKLGFKLPAAPHTTHGVVCGVLLISTCSPLVLIAAITWREDS